ncbi:MAG: hypothetical protein J3K34DRAFT_77189, partial [Monoraphidium minutum]
MLQQAQSMRLRPAAAASAPPHAARGVWPSAAPRCRCRCRCPPLAAPAPLGRPGAGGGGRSALVCRAAQQKQQQTEKAKPGRQAPGGKVTPSQSSKELDWRPFDAEAYNQPWAVPWGPGTVAGTMAAWVGTFLLNAFLVSPAAYVAVTRTPLWELGPAGQADFALW